MALSPILIDIPEVIETDRLILRAPLVGDGAAMNQAILETWESLRLWIPWARERPTVDQTEETVRQRRVRFLTREDLAFSIFLPHGPTFVGGVGLHRIDWSIPRFEIGYWVRNGFEGKGYASEVVRALTRFAFTKLGALRVDLHCSPGNAPSRRVADRCGFVLEGRLRNFRREPTGDLVDTMVYSMVPGDPGAPC